MRGSLLALNPGTAAGAGGIKNEYLIALGEKMKEHELKLFEEFALAYSAGKLPHWFYKVFQSLQTVAPFKDNGKEAVRPLCLKWTLKWLVILRYTEIPAEPYFSFKKAEKVEMLVLLWQK